MIRLRKIFAVLFVKKSINGAGALLVSVILLGGAKFGWAGAGEKIYSPIVEQGEIELEARGSYEIHDESKRDKIEHKYAVGYGATEWWFTELYVEFEKESSEDHEITAIEWENRFQLWEQGQYWLDAGWYIEYAGSLEEDHPDKIEGKLLLEKSFDKFVHTANIILEQEILEDHEEDMVLGTAWRTKYRVSEQFEPGLEYHAEFGEMGHIGDFDGQKHRLGPVIYGKLGGRWKYELGYLFGLSNAAADGTLKWVVELEI